VSVAGLRGSSVPLEGSRRGKKKKKKLIPAVLHFSITRSKTGREKEKKKKAEQRALEFQKSIY